MANDRLRALFRRALDAKSSKVKAVPEEPELHDPHRPPDTRDPRTKRNQ